jgi:predicted nuclease of predicted toxin-antitoxin system
MAKPKILLDEDVHSALSGSLRKRGYDAVHAQDLKRKGITDIEQLLFSAGQGRCLFTFNVKDFVVLHEQFILTNKTHFGIIVSKQLNFSNTFTKLLNVLQRNSQESLKNKLIFL